MEEKPVSREEWNALVAHVEQLKAALAKEQLHIGMTKETIMAEVRQGKVPCPLCGMVWQALRPGDM